MKQLRHISNLNQKELAEKIGLGVSSIRDHEAGRYPNKNTLQKYVAFFKCNRDWLLTGHSEPYNVPLDRLPKYTGGDKPDRRSLMDRFVFVRLADARLNAGGGLVVQSEEMLDYYAFRHDWLRKVATTKNSVVLMRVEGDSMANTVLEGDTVMVDLGRKEVKSGNIFALGVGDTVMLKRLEYTPHNKIKVKSDNPDHDDYELAPQEIRVIGQVIWIARQMVRFDI